MEKVESERHNRKQKCRVFILHGGWYMMEMFPVNYTMNQDVFTGSQSINIVKRKQNDK